MTTTSDGRAVDVPPVGGRSWWLDEALRGDPGAPCPPPAGEVAADVCVVGGGFAGLWTAYELTERQPSLGVVLLEADICGAGGSGANGGFFSCSWDALPSLSHFFGEEAAVRYATALADQVGELSAWVARHDADVDLHHEGILYARADDWQPEPDPRVFEIMGRHGLHEHLRAVDAAEARRVADSPRFRGGTFTPDSGTVQPAKLARELRRVLLERGVRICEQTPMTALHAGRPAIVETAQGRVRAAHVVLTTGAWAVRLPAFSRAFAVATDFMVVTEPVPGLLGEIGWTTHTGVADWRDLVYYLRRTDDDRVAIGGGGIGVVYDGHIGGRGSRSPRLAAAAARGLKWLFPQFEGVRFAAAWSGPMDMSRSSLPFFVTSATGNVHAGLGFSGHGLTPTKVGGKTLASLALGLDDEWARLPVVGPPRSLVPPEPLRWPAVRAMAWTTARTEARLEAGGERGAMGAALARVFETYSGARPRRRGGAWAW